MVNPATNLPCGDVLYDPFQVKFRDGFFSATPFYHKYEYLFRCASELVQCISGVGPLGS